MNKTVTINISGIIFHIDEDAYKSLSTYLNTIKLKFSNNQSSSEILADIESRIAELLSQKISNSKQVILLNDVNSVMETLGKPEDFADDEQINYTESNHFNQPEIKRRLFRDKDNNIFGGVCSGISAYLDVDLVWIRLAMVLLVFFGGLSLWVYIILWIVMPEAKTTADKLAMKGKPITIDNISASVKNEFETLGNKYGKGQQAKRMGESFTRGASNAVNTVGNIIKRAIGLFIVFVAGTFLIGYISTLFGVSVIGENENFNNWKNSIFSNGTDYSFAVIAFIIVVGIPVFMLLYAGIKLLLNIQYKNKWLNITMGIIWVVGFFLGLSITVKTAKEFSEYSKVKQTSQLVNIGDTLIVKAIQPEHILKQYNFNNTEDVENALSNGNNDFAFGSKNKVLSLIGNIELDVVESNTDSVEVVVYYNAQGNTKQTANNNAKNIKYQFKQNGNVLELDQLFFVAEGDKFRAQNVDVKIKLPKGKVILLDKSLKGLLDNVDNVTNTWDGDMVNRRWYMSERGLKCIDCEGLDTDKEFSEIEHEIKINKDITINENEININDKNTKVKISDEGIKVTGNEEKVKIDKNGIHITNSKEN